MRSRKRSGVHEGTPPQVDAIADGLPLPSGAITDPSDLGALRAAIELNAARPAADLPSDDFVAGPRRRLTVEQQPAPTAVSRRALLTGAGVVGVGAIAAGVVGVVADRTLLEPRGHAAAATTLEPDAGTWMPVATRAQLSDGKAHRFETATAVGFVSQQAGTLVAVSGVCTHQGCLLQADGSAGRLDCPCHRTSFGYGGDVLFSQLSSQPAPLPRITVRDNGESVEVFVPDESLA